MVSHGGHGGHGGWIDPSVSRLMPFFEKRKRDRSNLEGHDASGLYTNTKGFGFGEIAGIREHDNRRRSLLRCCIALSLSSVFKPVLIGTVTSRCVMKFEVERKRIVSSEPSSMRSRLTETWQLLKYFFIMQSAIACTLPVKQPLCVKHIPVNHVLRARKDRVDRKATLRPIEHLGIGSSSVDTVSLGTDTDGEDMPFTVS